MRLLDKLKQKSKFIAANAFSLLPVQGVTGPVFILGCGRSGTTIFGTALSKHHKIAYLNEPRHLWFAAYPETDIWTKRAAKRGGKLALVAADANERKSAKLRRLFWFETIITGRPLLVEKLPINSFRLPFIQEIFPDARFIHIHRSAIEVARSIAKQCEDGRWFSNNGYKWNELVRYSHSRGETATLPALCSNYFQMGLLEWRLSTEAAISFLRNLPHDRYFELSYEQLVQDPAHTMEHVFAFLNVGDNQDVMQFVRNNIGRKSSQLGLSDISDQDARIGGRLLPLSIDGESGLTRWAA